MAGSNLVESMDVNPVDSKPKLAYRDMILQAIGFNKSRKGTSRVAIYNFITANFSLSGSDKTIRSHLNNVLKSEVLKGTLKQNKNSYNVVLKEKKPKSAKPLKGSEPLVSSSKKVVAKKPIKKITSKPTASKIAAKSTASKTAAPKSTVSKTAAPKSTISKTAAPKSTSSKTAESKSTASKIASSKTGSVKVSKKKALSSVSAVKTPKPKHAVKKITTKSPKQPVKPAASTLPMKSKMANSKSTAPKTPKKKAVSVKKLAV